MSTKIKVLWVDDDFDGFKNGIDDTVDHFYNNDINIISCTNAEDAIVELKDPEKYDAVILDARFYTNKNSEDANLKGLGLVKAHLDGLERQNKYIPSFIYTSQADLLGDTNFNELYSTYSESKRIFEKKKGNEMDRLILAIKEAVKERKETCIRKKYKDLFSLCDPKYGFSETFEKDLLKHCFYIENGENTNDDIFNSTRKIMASFFKVCTDINLTPIGVGPIDNYESNDRPKFLCQGGRIQKLVPIYAQNLIDTFSIMQEGSHQYKEVVETVKKGKNPFLLTTLIYTVFSSLVWLKNYIDAHPDVEKTLEITKPLVDTFLQKKNEKQKRHEEQQAETNNRRTDQVDHQRYIIEKDENGILHAGNYYIRCCRDDIGKEVVITKIADNTDKATNTKYPKFARYEII